MLQKCQLTLSLALCLLLIQPLTSFAVEEFKVSENGKGEQVWFEAEAFDDRDSEDVYKLGKGEKAVDPADGAFGDIVTNVGGQGWLLYTFDISRAGGKAGDWRFIGRLINPSNHSDWLWVLGDDGAKIPEVAPLLSVQITSFLKKMFPHGHGCGPVILDRMVAPSTNYKTVRMS